MRPAVLSIARERLVSSVRNAVLAHAGYGVIPATSIDIALDVLRRRHVCAMVVGHSMDLRERRLLCREAHKHGVPAMVLDPYGQPCDDGCEMHMNPLDGPELLLDALESLVRREHAFCFDPSHC
jgi:hypothetical protein